MGHTPEEISAALTARQVSTQCPRCLTPEAFDIVPGFVRTEVTGGQNITSAALVCRRCGFTSLHNFDVLGLDF